MVAAAREVIAIVDRTKWGRAASATFCPTAQISVVLTDAGAPDVMVRALEAGGVVVRIVREVNDAAPNEAGASDATRSSL
jgi:DeoR/GlpR family transcriptional regulator of sugar metabolism